MGLNYFTINGTSSLDFGIVIARAGVFSSPARAYEEVFIPGKNGAVLFDEGRYENGVIEYECALLNDGANLDDFRAWISSHRGYVRLEDTYHLNEYRMAAFSGGLPVETEQGSRVGRFTVTFTAKPQRWLKTGEIPQTCTGRLSLVNPTYYPAKPLIRVTGYGSLVVGNTTITVATNALSYIDLDCELCDAFCGAINANRYITLSGTDYPVLPGNATTGITRASTMTSVQVWPRWWTL